MNEEEIISRIHDLIHTCDFGIEKHGEYDDIFELDKEALQGLLDLYNKKKEELDKEKEKNTELKSDLKNVLDQTLGAFQENWCIDWNFTEIREKYKLEE